MLASLKVTVPGSAPATDPVLEELPSVPSVMKS
jgi:hypothetical protein